MFVTELEVVNACLATLGQAPLNTLEDDHSYKAAAQTKLKTANLDIQKKGYWFNAEFLTLTPDATSDFIYVPVDALELRPVQYRGLSVAQRGNRLYNTAQNTYEFSVALRMYLIRLLPFEALPYIAAAAIRDEAVVRFQHEFDGDATRFRELFEMARTAKAELNAEEVRQRKPNLLRRHSIAQVIDVVQHPMDFSHIPYP